MQVQFKPKPKGPALSALCVRFDPTVNGNGGGGAGNGGASDSATVDTSTGHPVLVSSDSRDRDERGESRFTRSPSMSRFDGSFSQATSGFVGSPSDGLLQLDGSHSLTTSYGDAIDGNVVQTGRVAVSPNGGTVLALGFGASQAEAGGAAEGLTRDAVREDAC